jgi:hypothetical protein
MFNGIYGFYIKDDELKLINRGIHFRLEDYEHFLEHDP